MIIRIRTSSIGASPQGLPRKTRAVEHETTERVLSSRRGLVSATASCPDRTEITKEHSPKHSRGEPDESHQFTHRAIEASHPPPGEPRRR